MDYLNKLSDSDLEAFANGQMELMSDDGLNIIAGTKPSTAGQLAEYGLREMGKHGYNVLAQGAKVADLPIRAVNLGLEQAGIDRQIPATSDILLGLAKKQIDPALAASVESENPILSQVAKGLGQAAVEAPMAVIGAPSRVAGTIGQRIAQAAAPEAAMGLLSGIASGEGQGLQEQLKQGAWGTVLGGGVGGLLGAALPDAATKILPEWITKDVAKKLGILDVTDIPRSQAIREQAEAAKADAIDSLIGNQRKAVSDGAEALYSAAKKQEPAAEGILSEFIKPETKPLPEGIVSAARKVMDVETTAKEGKALAELLQSTDEAEARQFAESLAESGDKSAIKILDSYKKYDSTWDKWVSRQADAAKKEETRAALGLVGEQAKKTAGQVVEQGRSVFRDELKELQKSKDPVVDWATGAGMREKDGVSLAVAINKLPETVRGGVFDYLKSSLINPKGYIDNIRDAQTVLARRLGAKAGDLIQSADIAVADKARMFEEFDSQVKEAEKLLSTEHKPGSKSFKGAEERIYDALVSGKDPSLFFNSIVEREAFEKVKEAYRVRGIRLVDAGKRIRKNYATDINMSPDHPAQSIISGLSDDIQSVTSRFFKEKKGGGGTKHLFSDGVLAKYNYSTSSALAGENLYKTYKNGGYDALSGTFGNDTQKVVNDYVKYVLGERDVTDKLGDIAGWWIGSAYDAKIARNLWSRVKNSTQRFAAKGMITKEGDKLLSDVYNYYMATVKKDIPESVSRFLDDITAAPTKLSTDIAEDAAQKKTFLDLFSPGEAYNWKSARAAGRMGYIANTDTYKAALKETGNRVKALEIAIQNPEIVANAKINGETIAKQTQVNMNEASTPIVMRRRDPINRMTYMFTRFPIQFWDNIGSTITRNGHLLKQFKNGFSEESSISSMYNAFDSIEIGIKDSLKSGKISKVDAEDALAQIRADKDAVWERIKKLDPQTRARSIVQNAKMVGMSSVVNYIKYASVFQTLLPALGLRKYKDESTTEQLLKSVDVPTPSSGDARKGGLAAKALAEYSSASALSRLASTAGKPGKIYNIVDVNTGYAPSRAIVRVGEELKKIIMGD